MKTVLGVHDGHDAGAALIHGKEIYAVNEERLSREKYHRGFPERSIRELIRVLEIETQNIDKIAVAGIYRKKKRLLKMK
ncbi:MAG: carbamoyl transferase, partial [Candidatus Thermoplasmatota archaeon]|nr:carbamoyl transferase [Candidatus Thermoplasmatota archaeon]